MSPKLAAGACRALSSTSASVIEIDPTVATTSPGAGFLAGCAEVEQEMRSRLIAGPQALSPMLVMMEVWVGETWLSCLFSLPEPLREVGHDIRHDRDGRGASGHLDGIDLVDRVGLGVVGEEVFRVVDFERHGGDV